MSTFDVSIWSGLALLYAAFWWWYTMPRGPLRSGEIEALFERARREIDSEPFSEMEPRFRAFAESDDGREFFMVNLIEERKKPYQDESGQTIDPRQLNREYDREWARAYLPLAAFPLYIGKVVTPMKQIHDQAKWNKVAVVRYRSRRDFLNVALTGSVQASFDKKFASLVQTEVLGSVPVIVAAMPRVLVASILLAIGMLATRG